MAPRHAAAAPGIPLGDVLHDLSPHYHLKTAREPFSITLVDNRDQSTTTISRDTAPSLMPIRASGYDVLTEWLLPRSPSHVPVPRLYELGFFSTRARSPGRDLDYCISRVAYAPNPTLSPSGSFIASSLRHGGLHTFWGIDFHTVTLIRLPDEVARSTPRSREVCASVQRCTSGYSLSLSDVTRAKLQDTLENWCRSNPLRFARISGAGSRPSRPIPISMLTTVRVYCRSPDGECMRASLANALWRLGSDDVGNLLSAGRVPDDRFGSAASWLSEVLPQYTLEKRQTFGDPEPWLLRQTSSVFLVMLSAMDGDGDNLFHVVTVDCASTLILDPCETFALRLSSCALSMCMPNGSNVAVSDVRFVRKRETSSSSRKDRRKRKAKRSTESDHRRKASRAIYRQVDLLNNILRNN